MELLLFWFIGAIVVAIIANSKGRLPGPWFLYGFFLLPIAFVHILVISPTEIAEMARQKRAGRRPCPFCAEMIRPEAKVCPHCQRDLQPA